MARYTGPVCRLCRRVGEKLMIKGARCATVKCAMEKKPNPPGQRAARRRKVSDYELRLREKQKAKFIYGVQEQQFRLFFAKADRAPGMPGDNLVLLLERRLDNVAYRLGFAESRNQARQLVRHGHIKVNDRKVDIPSFIVKAGDVITWKDKSLVGRAVPEVDGQIVPGWLSLDRSSMSGHVLTLPAPSEITTNFNGKMIVEYYSR